MTATIDTPEPHDIALCSQASRMLAEAKTAPDFKKCADLGASAVVWAKRNNMGIEAVMHALEYQARAERGMGAALKAGEKNHGVRMNGKGIGGTKIEPPNNAPTLAEIGVTKKQSSNAQTLADISEVDFEHEIIKARDAKKPLAVSALVKKQRQKKQRAPRPSVEPSRGGIISNLSEIAGQKFACIYADPPWKYGNQSTRAATDNHYETMEVEDILALPIGDLAADKCHLHLWTTNAFLFECPRIFAAWGFEFKSSFVWVKPQMGIGNYWRNSHEILLLAVRGGMVAEDKGQMSWLKCSRGGHSAKPEEVRSRIEKLSPGPRLELFGRRKVEGWTVFGNQVAEDLL